MKEFVLTQPYNSLEEMLNSGEVDVYRAELETGNIEKYAIVSRIGNRYDLNGNKIEDFVDNTFLVKEDIPVSYCEIANEDVVKEAGITVEEMLEDKDMKYFEIEALIDKEVENAVAVAKAQYEQEIAQLKEEHAQELANAKAEVKAELLAKLSE